MMKPRHELKRDIPNTPMVGALLKATGLLKLETVIGDVEKKFAKKQKLLEANMEAIKAAYQYAIDNKWGVHADAVAV